MMNTRGEDDEAGKPSAELGKDWQSKLEIEFDRAVGEHFGAAR